MGELQVEVDPGEVGLSAERLARIEQRFARYVSDDLITGFQVAVTRHGSVAYVANHGMRDRENGLPTEPDTIYRIYSMTKAVTTVAAMVLHEEGAFELKDPVHRWIPSFRDSRVYVSGPATNPATEPLARPLQIWHLMTHTSGLTYGFHHAHAVDEMYRLAGFEWGQPPGMDLAAACDIWAGIPLLFQPGTEWNYSISVDVLGRLVEVISGQTLDQFLRERIFEPLGMVDTAFHVPKDEQDRLAALYVPNPAEGRRAMRLDGPTPSKPPTMLAGGGGLYSTTADYLLFLEMLRRGGEHEGGRLLGPRTISYMTTNHLPAGETLETFGRPLFSETTFDGTGFGLGFAVVDDPAAGKVPRSRGEYSWGGAASTAFWVDPVDDLTAVFMTQLLPSSTWPFRSQLLALVSQALVD